MSTSTPNAAAYLFPGAAFCDSVNRAAEFHPKTDDDTLPCLTIGGIQMYGYLHVGSGAVQLSVHLDEACEQLRRPDTTIPLRVCVGDHVVFDDSEQGRVTSTVTRQQLLRQLIIDHYGGNATAALSDLAGVGELAVQHLDRDWFDRYMADCRGIELTDEGWAKIRPHLSGYDDFITCNEPPNVLDEFADQVLKKAGLLLVGD